MFRSRSIGSSLGATRCCWSIWLGAVLLSTASCPVAGPRLSASTPTRSPTGATARLSRLDCCPMMLRVGFGIPLSRVAARALSTWSGLSTLSSWSIPVQVHAPSRSIPLCHLISSCRIADACASWVPSSSASGSPATTLTCAVIISIGAFTATTVASGSSSPRCLRCSFKHAAARKPLILCRILVPLTLCSSTDSALGRHGTRSPRPWGQAPFTAALIVSAARHGAALRSVVGSVVALTPC